jgi:hypothetical protein
MTARGGSFHASFHWGYPDGTTALDTDLKNHLTGFHFTGAAND